MEEKNVRASVSADKLTTGNDPNMLSTGKEAALESASAAAARAATSEPEKRQVYGTAKTENLRDNGLWRYILPIFVGLLCLGLLAVPLIILVPLLSNSFDVNGAANREHISLTWLWISMIVIEVGLAAVVIWGLVRIFMTQAGNYRR